VPSPARKTAAARVRQAEAPAQAAETARDAALLQLRSPAPGHQAAYLTNQVVNALNAPVEAARRELDEAGQAAAAVPAGSRSAPCPRTWSGWAPRPSRSSTPSGWSPATPKPFLAWFWMVLACGICALWWRGCGMGTGPASSDNGLGGPAAGGWVLRCRRGTRADVPGMRRAMAVRLRPVARPLVIAVVHRGVFFFISLREIVMRKDVMRKERSFS
jgi:hypothetical protein